MRILRWLSIAVAVVVGATPGSARAGGACCGYDAICYEDVTSEWCIQNGFHWWGEGSRCDGLPGGVCPSLGACCGRATPSAPDGTCDDATTEDECLRQCGKWFHDAQCSSFVGATCASAFHGAPPLPGDCNGDGEVVVNEVINAVHIALHDCSGTCCVDSVGHHYDGTWRCTRTAFIPPCPAADVNHDGHVFVSELVTAVGASLGVCRP